MWLLVSVSQPDLKFPLLGDHKYVVGRQNCDIVIPDASVSRKQAVLIMAHYETNVVKSYINPTLTLEDISKFGTFVNGKAVKNPGGNTVTLKHNDEIKFGGSPASVFKAVYEPFIATTSCLEKAPKKSLHKVMCLLGGHLVRDWRPTCDLLIMSKINVTIKVICAINNQKHIVTPQYLDDLYNHLMGRREKPDPANYLPEVVDQEVPQGVSFHPDARRATLLQGIKFYFLSAMQFNKTNLAVSTAGGQPILLEDGTEEEAEAMTEEGTVVVSVSRDVLATLSPSCQKFVKVVCTVLRRRNLRMVTDPEIGWAILTCNTDDFCNPRSSITPGMLSTMASQSLSQVTEIDASQGAQMTEIKPQKSSFVNVEDTDGTIKQSPVKKIKLEVPSQDNDPAQRDMKEVLKPEILSGQVGVEKIDPEIIPSGSHRTRTSSGNTVTGTQAGRNNQSDQQISEESVISRELAEPEQVSLSLPIKTKKPQGSGQQVDRETKDLPNKPEEHKTLRHEPLQQDADKPSEVTSVFARQKAKKNVKPSAGSLQDSDDEILESSSRKAPKRKSAFLFDDDDGDDNNDEDNSNSSSRKRLCQTEKAGKSTRIDAFSSGDENDDVAVVRNTSKGGRGRSEASEHLSAAVTGSMVVAADGFDSDGVHEEEVITPAVSGTGWLDMRKAKAKIRGEHGDSQGGGDGPEVKPDPELLRDKEGKVLRNLCEVRSTDLISRAQQPKRKSAPSSQRNDGGMKNFKKFKKTLHAGAGKLPTIIGGRDLEVYLGNKHKDIEDLFSNGLAQESERQEDERRGKDLFDWDDRTRKGPGVKRTR